MQQIFPGGIVTSMARTRALAPGTAEHSPSRRRLFAGVAAGLVLPVGAWGAASPRVHSLALVAGRSRQRLDPELPADTETWSYNGQVPGPLIRLRQGERLVVDFRNELAEGSAIHWHGLRIDNAMDGVVGMTQESVLPGETFHYEFTVPDAGTYWYHAHQRSSEQVGRGLYGVLVVDEPEPPDVDRDVVLVLDDWRLDETGRIHPSFGNLHDITHAGRVGNWLTVNGRGSETIRVEAGDRLRLRLVNTANSLVMTLKIPPWRAWAVSLDGMPLAAPWTVRSELVLSPGQRMDVIADVPAEPGVDATLDFHDRGQVIPLVGFSPSDYPGKPPRAESPRALPPNPVRPAAAVPDASTPLVMRGGAMGDLDRADYQGEMLDIRALARLGMVWAQNGVIGRPEKPLLSAPLGSTQEIVFENRTAWFHGMHLHGHHFEVPGAMTGTAESGGVLRDTVLIPPGERLAVKFLADNPGDWLLHCHMLEHQTGGMVTWIRVG